MKSAAHAMSTTTITSQNTTGKMEAMVVGGERGACELVAEVDARAGHPHWTHKFNFGASCDTLRPVCSMHATDDGPAGEDKFT